MIFDPSCRDVNRRGFLGRLLPVCTMACLGRPMLSLADNEERVSEVSKQATPNFTVSDVLRLNVQIGYVPLMRYFIRKEGEETFLKTLQDAYIDIWSSRMTGISGQIPNKNLQTFLDAFSKTISSSAGNIDPEFMNWFGKHQNQYEIIEQSDTVFAVKVTWCCYAEVYKEVEAAEIGYITHCHPDFVMAESFHPKMKLYRTKTLMQGDDHCDHRYKFEG